MRKEYKQQFCPKLSIHEPIKKQLLTTLMKNDAFYVFLSSSIVASLIGFRAKTTKAQTHLQNS